MTERGLAIVDGAPACPFVAFVDARDDRSDRPDPRHRCYAESPPASRARAHQEAYCLSANFPVCPTFQDWARREAARVIPSTAAAGSPAERLRDVPAQREAGTRPPAFGPTPASAAAPSPTPGLAASSGQDVMSEEALGVVADPVESASRPDDPDQGRHEPWDVPPRRSVLPEWSAPPPWAASHPGQPQRDPEPPEFLRSGPGASPEPPPGDVVGPWARPAAANDDEASGAEVANASLQREATIARLRALGIGGTPDAEPGEDRSSFEARPIAGTRSGEWIEQDGDAERPGDRGETGSVGSDAAAIGIAASTTPGEGSAARSSGGLARALGWDRRPKAGAQRAARRVEREPAWERPRRFEAYPTLKTRVGVPMPSRLVLAVAALLVAAAILFVVPPLFLRPAVGGPGATAAPAPSGSSVVSSARPSLGPTVKPSPTQPTYTVKKGDTLSTIAKKFGVTIEAILAANKAIKNPDKIAIGDVIVIPTAPPSDVVDGGASATP